MRTIVLLLAGLFALPSLRAADTKERLSNWPQWRGPLATGWSPTADPPLKWDEKSNIVWKCALADGASTPAVWGNAIFVTAQEGDVLSLVKIDMDTTCWGRAPASTSAVTTFAAAPSNCSTMSSGIEPSRRWAVCPATYTACPGAATTACE